jgi:hypothetical protein
MRENYRLLILFPRIWQTGALGALIYAIMSTLVALVICSTVVTDLSANSIPDSIFLLPKFSLLASGIATLFWIFRSTSHFRVGVLGYKIAPPRLALLLIVFGLLWVAPIASNYLISHELRRLANIEEAGTGYLRLQRVASLFGANAHYEPLKLQVAIQQLEPVERFSVPFIKELASAAVRPIEMFAPIELRGVVLTLLNEKIPACAVVWQSKSRVEVLADIDSAIARRLANNPTAEERELLRAERASNVDQTISDFDRYSQRFRECLDQSIQDTHLRKEDFDRELQAAQRNAYLIQIAHKAFGPMSSDFRQYASDAKFAAPDLLPFGIGDLTVFAVIAWMILLISIFYIASEFADGATFASVARNGLLTALTLYLVVSFFSSLVSIPVLGGRPSIFDTLASNLHWPALITLPLCALAMIGTVPLFPSSYWSRFLLLTTFVGLPLALVVETLNAVNSLASVNYQNGNCPTIGWVVTARIHCAVYSTWQPLVREAGETLANQLHWAAFWQTPASRISIAAALAILFAWLILPILVFLLKREFVRPRDR